MGLPGDPMAPASPMPVPPVGMNFNSQSEGESHIPLVKEPFLWSFFSKCVAFHVIL